MAPPQDYPAEAIPAHHPQTDPETPTLYLRLTVPTGWHRDAPSSLFRFSELPPVNDLTSHIANHDETRRRELAHLPTTLLRQLYFSILHELENRATTPLPSASVHRRRPPDHHRPFSYEYQTLLGAPDVKKALRSPLPPDICTLVMPLYPDGGPLALDPLRPIPLPTMGPASLTHTGLASLARTSLTEARERNDFLRPPGPQGP